MGSDCVLLWLACVVFEKACWLRILWNQVVVIQYEFNFKFHLQLAFFIHLSQSWYPFSFFFLIFLIVSEALLNLKIHVLSALPS